MQDFPANLSLLLLTGDVVMLIPKYLSPDYIYRMSMNVMIVQEAARNVEEVKQHGYFLPVTSFFLCVKLKGLSACLQESRS